MLLRHVQNLSWNLRFLFQNITEKNRCAHLGHEIYGIGSLGSFTTPNISLMYISNPDARRGVGRRQILRIRNGMDESEAGKKEKRCNLCGADGHT